MFNKLTFTDNFNPHSPCGERLHPSDLRLWVPHFNPHSPCGERQLFQIIKGKRVIFQSTLPMRGATFSPFLIPTSAVFQSTLPMRGATGYRRGGVTGVTISIHTPHAGSDSKSYRIHIKFKNKIYDIRNKNKL